MCLYKYIPHGWVSAYGGHKRGIGSPGAGVSGGCELLNVGTENSIWVLWWSSKHSKPLSHLPLSPFFLFYSHTQGIQSTKRWGHTPAYTNNRMFPVNQTFSISDPDNCWSSPEKGLQGASRYHYNKTKMLFVLFTLSFFHKYSFLETEFLNSLNAAADMDSNHLPLVR